MTTVATVLYICIENANRSQMAEAFTHIHGRGVLRGASAGSHPAEVVGAGAVAAMAAIGYDLTTHRPKGLDEVGPGAWDYVVTMGCGDVCPWVPTRRQLDWDLPDPRDASPSAVAAIRDEIERRVLALVETVRADG